MPLLILYISRYRGILFWVRVYLLFYYPCPLICFAYLAWFKWLMSVWAFQDKKECKPSWPAILPLPSFGFWKNFYWYMVIGLLTVWQFVLVIYCIKMHCWSLLFFGLVSLLAFQDQLLWINCIYRLSSNKRCFVYLYIYKCIFIIMSTDISV